MQLIDQALDISLELFIFSHIQPKPGSHPQTRSAGLAHNRQQSALTRLEPQVFGEDVLEFGEVTGQVRRRQYGKRVAALLHGASHLQHQGYPQAEIPVINARPKAPGLQSGL